MFNLVMVPVGGDDLTFYAGASLSLVFRVLNASAWLIDKSKNVACTGYT